MSPDSAPPTDKSEPRGLGEVVADRYELLDVLGEGLSGRVYRARDLYVGADPEIVALKVLHRELIGDRQLAGRFRREAAICKRLVGPHLCRLLDSVEEEDLFLVALEYVDGPSLEGFLGERERLGLGRLSLDEVVAIVTQIGEALEAAHEVGVVHRDLKPSNVLVEGGYAHPRGSFTRELSVRVVDFGLAKIVSGDGGQTVLTEHNMVFGTPDYMAPEQVAGEPLDPRSDVYALGVVLYQLLSGRLPYRAGTAVALMKAHLREAPTPLREAAPDAAFPQAVERVVERALAKDREDRWPSVRALVEALVLASDGPTLSELLVSRPVDTERDVSSGGVTMPSLREEAAAAGRGARVQVVVPGGGLDSTQASLDKTVEYDATPAPRPSTAPARVSARDEREGPKTHPAGVALDEGRGFTVVAILVALAAVALGAWLGLR